MSQKANRRKMMIFTYRPLELKVETINVIEAKKVEIRKGSTMIAKRTPGAIETSPVKINLKMTSRIPGTRVKSSR